MLHFCTEHRDAEQEDQEFRHPLLHTEFKARVGYMRPSQNTQQTQSETKQRLLWESSRAEVLGGYRDAVKAEAAGFEGPKRPLSDLEVHGLPPVSTGQSAS